MEGHVPTPQHSSSEATTVRTMMDPERDALPSHNLTIPLPVFASTTKPCHPCPLTLPGRWQVAGTGLALPSSQVPFPLPAQTLGPIQPEGSWGLMGESLRFSRTSLALGSQMRYPALGRGAPSHHKGLLPASHNGEPFPVVFHAVGINIAPPQSLGFHTVSPILPTQGGSLTLPLTHRVL